MTRILFVCVENACRSQMAEAFARELGGPGVEARSAGSRPSGRVHPTAVEVMAERGIDLTDHRSEGVEAVLGKPFDLVVSMGCGDACPRVRADRRLEWDVEDPAGGPREKFVSVRDEIERRVRDLLASERSTDEEAAAWSGT